MKGMGGWGVVVGVWLGLAMASGAAADREFSVATYNLENYLESARGTRPAKSEAAKAKIVESLLAVRADVVALQEVGSEEALVGLRETLKRRGLDYAHWELASGFDTNIHVAVLSRYPFVARNPHTNEGFLLYGRRFRVSRAFAEVEVQVNDRYRFTLITAHLKSRRESASADQADLREQEAMRLRRIIDARLQARPESNVVVLGDFNDHPESPALRILMSKGKRHNLVDTRPGEGDAEGLFEPGDAGGKREVTWTHYYAREDVYSRIDYVLVSRGMAREWDSAGSYVLRMAGWGVASDHRPVVVRFRAVDR